MEATRRGTWQELRGRFRKRTGSAEPRLLLRVVPAADGDPTNRPPFGHGPDSEGDVPADSRSGPCLHLGGQTLFKEREQWGEAFGGRTTISPGGRFGVYWFPGREGWDAFVQLAAEAGRVFRNVPASLRDALATTGIDPLAPDDDAQCWLLALLVAPLLEPRWDRLRAPTTVVADSGEVVEVPLTAISWSEEYVHPELADQVGRKPLNDYYRVLEPGVFAASAAACELIGGYEGVHQAQLRRPAGWQRSDEESSPPVQLLNMLWNLPGVCQHVASFVRRFDEDQARRPQFSVRASSFEEAAAIADAMCKGRDERVPMEFRLATLANAERLRRQCECAYEALASAAPMVNSALNPGSMAWSVGLGAAIERAQDDALEVFVGVKTGAVLKGRADSLDEVAEELKRYCSELKAALAQGLLAGDAGAARQGAAALAGPPAAAGGAGDGGDSNGQKPPHKPGGWTRREIISEVKDADKQVRFSGTTFDALRKAAKLPARKRSARQFSNAEMRALADAAERGGVVNGRHRQFSDGRLIAEIIRGLLPS